MNFLVLRVGIILVAVVKQAVAAVEHENSGDTDAVAELRLPRKNGVQRA